MQQLLVSSSSPFLLLSLLCVVTNYYQWSVFNEHGDATARAMSGDRVRRLPFALESEKDMLCSRSQDYLLGASGHGPTSISRILTSINLFYDIQSSIFHFQLAKTLRLGFALSVPGVHQFGRSGFTLLTKGERLESPLDPFQEF